MAPSPQDFLSGQRCKFSGCKFKIKKTYNHIVIRLGTWNVGSLYGKEIKVVEELRKRKADICGL